MDPEVASSNFSSDLSGGQKELIQPLICEEEGLSSPPSQIKGVDLFWARLPNDSSVQSELMKVLTKYSVCHFYGVVSHSHSIQVPNEWQVHLINSFYEINLLIWINFRLYLSSPQQCLLCWQGKKSKILIPLFVPNEEIYNATAKARSQKRKSKIK